MPLAESIIETVRAYCANHLPEGMEWYLDQFSFVDDDNLRNQLGVEFYLARYMTKLMEALAMQDYERYFAAKFQVIQYASIYESIISYLLWEKFPDHGSVRAIEFTTEFKQVQELSGDINYTGSTKSSTNSVYVCVKSKRKLTEAEISFPSKVNAAKEIGFIDEKYVNDIKKIYTLRNAIHINTAVQKQIKINIDSSKLAYRGMEPFLDGIRRFLAQQSVENLLILGSIDNSAKPAYGDELSV